MNKLTNIRNYLYVFLSFFIVVVPILSALFFSAENYAYFGTNINFEITKNKSNYSTEEINEKLSEYTDSHQLVLAKRIYVEKNDTISPQTQLIGKNSKYYIDRHKSDKHNESKETGLLTSYGVFGTGNKEELLKYLEGLDISFVLFNPNSLRSIQMDMTTQLFKYNTIYILTIVLLSLTLINGFIVIKSRKKLALVQLFTGRKKRKVLLFDAWKNIEYFIFSYSFFTIISLGFTHFYLKNMLKYLAVFSTILFFAVAAGLIFALLIFEFISNRESLLNIFKGKSRMQVAILPIVFIFSITLLLFGNTINLNMETQSKLDKVKSEKNLWEDISNFKLIAFFSGTGSDSELSNLGTNLLKNISESDIYYNSYYPNYGIQGQRNSDLKVNPTFLEKQKVFKNDGNKISEKDLNNPYTLLSSDNLSREQIDKIYARPHFISPDDIKVIKIKPKKLSVLTQIDADKVNNEAETNNIFVTRFTSGVQLTKDKFLTSGEETNFPFHPVADQFMTQISQQHVELDLDKLNSKNDRFINHFLPDMVQETTSSNKIRNSLERDLKINKYTLEMIMISSFIIMIIASYLYISIFFIAFRKKLFIKKIFGKSFLSRYTMLYGLFLLSIIPACIFTINVTQIIKYFILIIIILIVFFTVQIMLNEKKTYKVLKGKL